MFIHHKWSGWRVAPAKIPLYPATMTPRRLDEHMLDERACLRDCSRRALLKRDCLTDPAGFFGEVTVNYVRVERGFL